MMRQIVWPPVTSLLLATIFALQAHADDELRNKHEITGPKPVLRADGSVAYPVDPKTEPLMATLMKAKEPILREGEQELLESFNPKRPDYLVARLNKDGIVEKFDSLSGATIRQGYAIVNAYMSKEKLDDVTAKMLDDALRAYPAYNALNDKTATELVDRIGPASGSKVSLYDLVERTAAGPSADADKLKDKLLLMAVAYQVDLDVHGAWKAQVILREAKKIQAERDAKAAKEAKEAKAAAAGK